MAKRKLKITIVCEWTVDDLMDRFDLTKEQAQKFIENYEDELQDSTQEAEETMGNVLEELVADFLEKENE